MRAPDKITISKYNITDDGDVVFAWLTNSPDCEPMNHPVEYVRTDAFIEKAAEFLYNYNQKQVLKHGARATLGCGEYTINVDEFRKYMEDSL